VNVISRRYRDEVVAMALGPALKGRAKFKPPLRGED